MPIIQEATGVRIPVASAKAIGERFIGAFVRKQQRDQLKDGQPILKDNGKARQELVVWCVVMPGTTVEATIGGEGGIPAPGDVVRLIIKGLTYSQWIEQTNALRGVDRSGDVIELEATTAQAYDPNGSPKGSQITDQAAVIAARMKGITVGVYGDLKVRAATTSELPWIKAAEAAEAGLTKGPTVDDDEPF